MNKPSITSAQMSALLPTSLKVISETLTPEAMNLLTSEMAEVNSRLEAQKVANEQLKTDYDTEKSKVTSLEAEKVTLTTDKTSLNNEVTRLKPFEDKIKELTSAGKINPNEDINSRQQNAPLPTNHYNAVALSHFKAEKGII